MVGFNPRLREGGDKANERTDRLAESFNPRLREGGDVWSQATLDQHLRFNPRLREGGDQRRLAAIRANCVSIHASAREATRSVARFQAVGRFQSTPPRGRRR